MLKYYQSRYLYFAVLLVGLLFIPDGYAGQRTEIRDKNKLRVCADPNNLPFSNRSELGFENRIAHLIADNLGVEVVYTWFPQSQGFVRSTLNAYKCDLIVGISGANPLVLNTNPYYQSVFSIVYRNDLGFDIETLSDKNAHRLKRIGLVSGTSPTNILLKYNLIEQMAPYHLYVDTRKHSSGQQMINDLLEGKLDAAILWGPIAGYHVNQYKNRLVLMPLTADDTEDNRVIYKITMGVRIGEVEWKRELNRILKHEQSAIRNILLEYKVPIVDK